MSGDVTAYVHLTLSFGTAYVARAAGGSNRHTRYCLAAGDGVPSRFNAKAQAARVVTFTDLASLWTSGELARRHPDHVKLKRSVEHDEQRFVAASTTAPAGAVPSLCGRCLTRLARRSQCTALPRYCGACLRGVWSLGYRDSPGLRRP